MQGIKLFTGNSNPAVAGAVADHLGIEPGKAYVGTFSDGEVRVELNENVRGADCFVIQSTGSPANTNLMELLIMVDALRRASARRITAVIPYFGYARQDRKVTPRVPITAKLVSDLICTAGTDRVLCIDLHAGQIQGFFNIPVDNLFATPVLLEAMQNRFSGPVSIISPDAGGVERSRAYAKRIGAELAIIDKRREGPNVAEVMNVVGNVRGQTCVIVDDMVDTAGTLCAAAKAIMREGAQSVAAVITHAVLSGPAIKRIAESPLTDVIVTDTIPLSQEGEECEKLQVVSIANLMGEAIRRINNEESISSLFI